MEVAVDEGVRFKKAWYLILYLAPAIACLWLTVFGELRGLRRPWLFWLQAPAGAEQLLGKTVITDSRERNLPGLSYIRTQDGQLYEYSIGDGWVIAQLTPAPEDEQMGREYRPWEQPSTRLPFIPFVLNPPPGRVIDTFKRTTSVNLFIMFESTDEYLALLADGSIWSWADPMNDLYISASRIIGIAHAIASFLVAVVIVRRLNRTNGRPRIWRRGFTTTRDKALGVALFTLLCLILALVGIIILGFLLLLFGV